MSGETGSEETGWTVDTLNYAFSKRFEDLEDKLQERYETQIKATDAAFAAQQMAMQTAFAAADKAVDKALAAAEKAVDRALAEAEKSVSVRAEAADREFHEHLEQVRHENQLAFINSDKAINAAFTASEKAIEAALSAAKEAVSKAEMSTEKRFESVNEFRAQLADQTASFITRGEYAATEKAMGDKVSLLTDRLNVRDGAGDGKAALWGYFIAAVAAIGTIVIVVNLLIAGK